MKDFLATYSDYVLAFVTVVVLPSCAYFIKTYFVTKVQFEAARAEDRAAITPLAENVALLADRMTTTETILRNLPTEAQYHTLTLRQEEARGDMRALGAQVSAINENLTALNRNVSIIQQFLMQGDK